MGRRSKLTPEAQQTICDALLLPMTMRDACALAGVHEATAYRWMQLGEKQTKGKYFEFRKAVLATGLQVRRALVGTIRTAARHDWRAAQALLAMSYAGDGYVVQSRTQVSGKVEASVSVEETAKDAAERLSRMLAEQAVDQEEGSDS